MSRDLALVYGGARVGLMGLLADRMLAAGGHVTGVMPRALFRREVPHEGLSELIEVASMHERKATMTRLADAFVAMPGGLGTLEEMFESLTWAQLGLHKNPVGLLNVAGYYDRLIAFLDHATDERFIREVHRDMLLIDDEPGRLLDRFAHYRPPAVQKWIDLDQA